MNSQNNQQIDERQLDKRARRHQYYLEHKEHAAYTNHKYYIEHAQRLAILRRQKRVQKSFELNGTIPEKRMSKYDIHSKIIIEPCKGETYSFNVRTQHAESKNKPRITKLRIRVRDHPIFKPNFRPVMDVENEFNNCVQPFMNVNNCVQSGVQPFMNVNNCVQSSVQPFMNVNNGFDNCVQPFMNVDNGFNNCVQPSNGEINVL